MMVGRPVFFWDDIIFSGYVKLQVGIYIYTYIEKNCKAEPPEGLVSDRFFLMVSEPLEWCFVKRICQGISLTKTYVQKVWS